MSADVIPIVRAFDPLGKNAEREYDRVADRINQLTALGNRTQRDSSELRRQFIENDLMAVSGGRRGQPLTEVGRRRRLDQLRKLETELNQIDEEREVLAERLDLMNEAIECWARETYGSTT